MTSQDQAPIRPSYRIPPAILTPLGLIVGALYPGIWSPYQPVRRVASTLMVLGLVWLVLVAVASFERRVLTITAPVIEQRARQIRDEAIAELDGLDERDFDDLIRRLTAEPPRWPDSEMY